MKIFINLKVKWKGSDVIITPTVPTIVEPPIVNPKPILPEVIEPPVIIEPPIIVEPEPSIPNNEVDWSKAEIVEFTDEFYRLVNRNSTREIYLEEGKIYRVSRIQRRSLIRRTLKIHSGPKRAILLFGHENYSPLLHGPQDGSLFMMMHDSNLIIKNVNFCQLKQLRTVQYFNPRIFESLAQNSVNFNVVIENCDTTVLGNNGGWGTGFTYGHPNQNHTALINFKHYGVGLMDAKNPWKDGINYITLRNVEAYAREDANLSSVDFQHIGTLKNDILTFDGSVYELTSGYNWNWRDNDSYIVLQDRFTFFLDGFKSDTVVSNNQFRVRPQAKGICNFGVMDNRRVFSNEFEMHAGDKFIHNNIEYTVIEKDRIQWPWFDSRTTQAIQQPDRARAIVYRVDKDLPVSTGTIEIDYKGEVREFTDSPITLTYRANSGFRTTPTTKYRERDMITSRGIGHLSYNHSDISMDAANVKHRGFYRGSEKGNGTPIIWNLYNCEGFEESGAWFMPGLPVTNIPDLPLHERITKLLEI